MLYSKVGDMTFGFGTHGSLCCPHFFPGIIITGNPSVLINNLPSAILMSINIHFCPHCSVGFVMTSSPTVLTSIGGLARLNDMINEICGIGKIISGSPNVIE